MSSVLESVEVAVEVKSEVSVGSPRRSRCVDWDAAVREVELVRSGVTAARRPPWDVRTSVRLRLTEK